MTDHELAEKILDQMYIKEYHAYLRDESYLFGFTPEETKALVNRAKQAIKKMLWKVRHVW